MIFITNFRWSHLIVFIFLLHSTGRNCSSVFSKWKTPVFFLSSEETLSNLYPLWELLTVFFIVIDADILGFTASEMAPSDHWFQRFNTCVTCSPCVFLIFKEYCTQRWRVSCHFQHYVTDSLTFGALALQDSPESYECFPRKTHVMSLWPITNESLSLPATMWVNLEAEPPQSCSSVTLMESELST